MSLKAGDLVTLRRFWDVWRSDGFCEMLEEGILFDSRESALSLTVYKSQKLDDEEVATVLDVYGQFVRVFTCSGKSGWMRARYWSLLISAPIGAALHQEANAASDRS